MNNLTLEQHIQHQHQLQAIMSWGMGAFLVASVVFYAVMVIEPKIRRNK